MKKDGTSLCHSFNTGKECKNGNHVLKCTDAMRNTKLYNRLNAERGKPNAAQNPPKPPQAAGGQQT